MKKIQPESINAIESATLAVASSYTIPADEYGRPTHFIISMCINPEKAMIKDVEIPLYISPDAAYMTEGHIQMLDTFLNGEPFCAIECDNLQIFYDEKENKYYATADSFTVPDNFDKWEDIIYA